MGRTEYFDDPQAPDANSLVPAASAVVEDDQGRVLLHLRSDSGNWSIPGGAMEPGESQSGPDDRARGPRRDGGPRPTGADRRRLQRPGHVVAYDDGEVRQEFSVCFGCEPIGGAPSADSKESDDVRWVARDELATLSITPAIRRRLDDHFAGRSEASFG
jgi:8-oxo-dGTP pyrophosphatase MutT (NUDIX family)